MGKSDLTSTKKVIVELHGHVKSLMLLAEELEPENESYISLHAELKHALDHLMRAHGVEWEMVQPPNDVDSETYVSKQYGKAFSHLYRAFFDVADWAGIILREHIIATFKPFSPEAISEVFPEYYKKIRPQLEKINTDIARFRERKDIGREENVLPEVERYNSVLQSLIETRASLEAKIPSLVEYDRKNWIRRAGDILIGVLSGIAIGLIVYLITHWKS